MGLLRSGVLKAVTSCCAFRRRFASAAQRVANAELLKLAATFQ